MDLRAATGRARTAVCREHPALPGAEHQRVDEQPVLVLLQVLVRGLYGGAISCRALAW